MTIHRGRLFDHIHLRVKDLEKSKRFYRAVCDTLGLGRAFVDAPDHFTVDELWVDAAEGPVSHVHFAFQANGTDMVRRFHEVGLLAGGEDHGAPGERPYHPGYYAAYLLDPDGNNVEAVYHGPAIRSAPSVELTPA